MATEQELALAKEYTTKSGYFFSIKLVDIKELVGGGFTITMHLDSNFMANRFQQNSRIKSEFGSIDGNRPKWAIAQTETDGSVYPAELATRKTCDSVVSRLERLFCKFWPYELVYESQAESQTVKLYITFSRLDYNCGLETLIQDMIDCLDDHPAKPAFR